MIRPRIPLLFIALCFLAPWGETVAESGVSHMKASVYIDPSNKMNLRGNVSIALAWGDHFSPPQEYLRGFINLKEAMLKWTKVETSIENHLLLGTPRLLELPFVYITVDNSFNISSTEKTNIRKYLENGGFMVIENPLPRTEAGPAEAALKQMIRDALGSRAKFQPIPRTHELFHCFFDFNDGPPNGSEIGLEVVGDVSDKQFKSLAKPALYLEGVWLDNRLAVVFSNKGYIVKWTDMKDNDPQLKMGVNMIVFALTQEGGIALRN